MYNKFETIVSLLIKYNSSFTSILHIQPNLTYFKGVLNLKVVKNIKRYSCKSYVLQRRVEIMRSKAL